MLFRSKILERFVQTNMEQTNTYGMDDYCKQAADRIKEVFGAKNSDVHFLVGGTQTNLTIIDSALRTHQGVISAETGHINVHETGAIEACGHKVIALPSDDGKLKAEQIDEFMKETNENESKEHIVQPKLVYLSNPTELGTIYAKNELKEISEVCKKYGLFLFVDGARLGYGLVATDNSLEYTDFVKYCDAFSIGGTKVGALFGEAIVVNHEYLKQDFRYIMKQNGGMLAKGRLLGIQFLTLFEDGLYFEISKHAIDLADQIRAVLTEKGYSYLVENRTNQIFPIISDEKLAILKKEDRKSVV